MAGEFDHCYGQVRLVYVYESYCNIYYYVIALLVSDTEVQALTTAVDTVVRRATASSP
jgi:hypothetical protein